MCRSTPFKGLSAHNFRGGCPQGACADVNTVSTNPFPERFMTKKRRISITTLALVSAASLLSAAAIMGGTIAASADREVALTGGNYFYTSGDAEISEQQQDGAYYTSFVFADGDSRITYRKNLAYHWFSSVRDDEGNPTAEAQEGYLSTEIGFDELTFESFTIQFQSQQYTQTEDGVTENYVTFIPEGGSVYVKIGDPLPEDATERAEEIESITSESEALSPERISVNFSDYASGVYQVSVSDGSSSVEGEFTNVGGSYASYVSSNSATSVIPLTYSAQFAEGSSGSASMVLYSFNGQSFELTGDEGERTINDNTPPVICLSESFNTIDYGRNISVDYAVIDMLATSPRSSLSYYILTNEQLEAGDLNATGDESNFISVSSGSVAPVIRGNDTFVPESEEGASYNTECLVKFYYTVQDSTASGGNSDNVFIDWYVPAEYKYTVTAGDGQQYDFIRATDDGEGATYVLPEGESYQQLVNEAIEAQQASAGDDKSFYLPSYENFISDNVTSYSDLTFSIYYISSSTGSVTSLAVNELSLSLSADGLYRFAIYATDVAGNDMYYIDDEGEKVTFAASELTSLLEDPANSKLTGYVPVYQFEVNYGGLTVTDPEGQEIGYVGTQYTASDFDISGLSSNYETTYTLYIFDRLAYTRDHGNISYARFIGMVSDLFNDPESRAAYFQTIESASDVETTDPNYELYTDYNWNPSNLSFTPQADNSFYVIRMSAKDNVYNTPEIEGFMAISVSAAADHLAGESDWLENNIASVVLLCVAGVALIGIILLVVIKPKEKGDIDVIDEKASKRSANKLKANK